MNIDRIRRAAAVVTHAVELAGHDLTELSGKHGEDRIRAAVKLAYPFASAHLPVPLPPVNAVTNAAVAVAGLLGIHLFTANGIESDPGPQPGGIQA